MKSTYIKYDSKKLTASDYEKIIPRYLYKYRVINDNFFDSLSNSRLWFSNPADFNDPFDCSLQISMGRTTDEIHQNLKGQEHLVTMRSKELQEALDRMITEKPEVYNVLMDGVQQLVIQQTLGVCCLAEDPDNVLLWSHYASCHAGACMEFEIERDGFFYRNVLPVQYKKKYPVFDLGLPRFKQQENPFYTMFQHAVCTKSFIWEYEHEWRVIDDGGKGHRPFEKKHLKRIIFGIRTPKDAIARVRAVLEQSGYSNTKLCQYETYGKSFRMRLKSVEKSDH
jgi:hypothetical protein